MILGIWFQVRFSKERPAFFLFTPPHCLKKNGIRASMHWSRISAIQPGSIGRAFEPDPPQQLPNQFHANRDLALPQEAAQAKETSNVRLFHGDHHHDPNIFSFNAYPHSYMARPSEPTVKFPQPA